MHIKELPRKRFVRRGEFELDRDFYWCEKVDLELVTRTIVLIEYPATGTWTRYDSEDDEVLLELGRGL